MMSKKKTGVADSSDIVAPFFLLGAVMCMKLKNMVGFDQIQIWTNKHYLTHSMGNLNSQVTKGENF